MSSKRGKRSRSTKKSASTTKQHEQLSMNVIDHGATISSSNAQNHFGYSPFELTINVDPHCNNLEPQPLNIQLVFEDGQQIDSNNNKNSIQFHTIPQKLYLDQNGQCKFTVQIDTHSMFHENQAFKLVFNLGENATRHIRPCETKPFRLVKHRLEIVMEPDDTFYKDEGGRANCLRCKLVLRDSSGNTVKNRDIPLIAKLVYEDMTSAVSSRDILEILTQNVELKKGQCQVDFRINEVSKNHNKRAFRVLYECRSQDALYHDISSCVTNKITVKSKRTKKKGTKGGRGGRKAKAEPKKRKRETRKVQQYTESSEESVDLDDIDLESDEEPSRKRARKLSFNHHHHHNQSNNPYSSSFDPHRRATLPSSVLNNMDINGDMMDNTQYVPPALTGILPSIRPGALPRIGHQPPPFASLSKVCGNPYIEGVVDIDSNETIQTQKNSPLLKTEGGGIGTGGVLGHMFNWCKLAGWVMNRLEWTACGYEYDEATHSIDTTRPLFRCSYCLKYRNITGWGNHENWCQLKLALKEYETKVKSLNSEWNYQINNVHNNNNNKDNINNGGMTTMDGDDSSPPKNNNNKDKNNNSSSPNNNKSDKNNNNNMTLPSINTAGPVLSAGLMSVVQPNGINTHQTSAGPFAFAPNQSNGTLWGIATYHQQQSLNTHSLNPTGFPPQFANHPTQQSPLMSAFGNIQQQQPPPPQPQTNHHNGNKNGAVKPELLNQGNHHRKNNNVTDINLPNCLHKVDSVSRVPSQHGYDAYDKDKNYLGSFDGTGAFFEADQLNDDQYRPTFDSNNMLTRNQSDDTLFYNNIRTNIFDLNTHHK